MLLAGFDDVDDVGSLSFAGMLSAGVVFTQDASIIAERTEMNSVFFFICVLYVEDLCFLPLPFLFIRDDGALTASKNTFYVLMSLSN